jgi:phage terminase large subunit-like protein
MGLSHVDRAQRYAEQVCAGELPACKWVRKACERHLADLERAKGDWLYSFDEAKAERVCRFGEMLPHIKGAWARRDVRTKRAQTITLEPWQCFVLSMLFGWVKKLNGMRRFRRASIYIPRKNGKSTLAAIIGWWMFAKDDEPGAEVYSGATSEKQAWEVFGPARQMAVSIPEMPQQLGVTVNARSLVDLRNNSKFEPIIGKPGDGASPHLAIVDEFHEHLDSTLHDTMITGMGARTQPLLLIISTAGENLTGPCRDDWADCEKLLDGAIEDETHFAIVWTIDAGDDWTTEIALRKANPNFDVSVSRDFLLAQLSVAKRDPAKQGIFKTKHLNQWVSAAKGWLNMEKWKVCGSEAIDFDAFAGADCWAGLDAASRIDMTSLVALFRHEGGYAVFANHYIPEDTVSLPQNAHYRKWVDAGYLIATPGSRVDFTLIEEDLRTWSKRFNIQQLGFDPKELNDFINRVSNWASFELVEVRQSPELMSGPMKEMEALVETGKLRHENDPILTWMASNVVKKEGRGGGPVKYYYPTKAKDQNKIDGIVATILALSRAILDDGSGKSVYETRGIEAI